MKFLLVKFEPGYHTDNIFLRLFKFFKFMRRLYMLEKNQSNLKDT
jgi:hypothetical protein